ncbi:MULTISPECIES: DUF1285 domain-containing protein [unclassified Moraxella]|uniref:DUF1285 domain-containing protein n=1 Tax=unclassified Moraxella TaxID=2685852 RepID=UPI003AF476C6
MNSLFEQLNQALASTDSPVSGIADPRLPTTRLTRPIPPLEKWQPQSCGAMDMLIKANGDWWHEGRLVTRQSLVELFSKVLWAEEGDVNGNGAGEVQYFLKTPVEKIQIQVEDAPIIVTEVEQIEHEGQTWLQFCTAQGDVVIADDKHPISLGFPYQNQPHQANQPYLLVRQNGDSKLYGLIHRNVFYHLIELGELHATATGATLVLNSGDNQFELVGNF